MRVCPLESRGSGATRAMARARADRERLGARCAVVAASGPHLPFAGESFDAVVHTDVLC
jgi:hypothetical protein